MLEITEIRFEIRNQVRNQKLSQKSAGIKVISRTWKSQKSGLKSVEIRNQLEIKVISKSRRYTISASISANVGPLVEAQVEAS